MPLSTNLSVATMGIDIGKNSFHVVGLDQRGAIVVRQRWTRSQIPLEFGELGSTSPGKTDHSILEGRRGGTGRAPTRVSAEAGLKSRSAAVSRPC
jgi:hypothetical protein